MKDKVNKAIEKIKTVLAADGGSVVVKVRLTGACGCCPHAAMTLKGVVERMIMQDVPEVKEIVVG